MPPPTILVRTPSEKLMSLQYVRALASIVVISWHTGWSYTVLGQAGVDLFFVVSGFVMMLVSGRENSPGRFGLARILRIVPLYWGVTIVAALLDHPPGSKLVTSLLFWPSDLFPVVIQGWSLNLEMLYYLLFAVTLFAPIHNRLQLLTLEMIVLCLGLPLVFETSGAVLVWSNPLAFEFLAGAALYYVWRAHYLPVGLAAWTMGIAGLIVLTATHRLGGGPTGWMRLAFWGLPAAAIVGAGLGIERVGQLPHIKVLGVLGEASYSIYLTHVVALRLLPSMVHGLPAPVALSIALVWACLFGVIVHRIVELPIHRVTRSLLGQLWPKPQLTSA